MRHRCELRFRSHRMHRRRALPFALAGLFLLMKVTAAILTAGYSLLLLEVAGTIINLVLRLNARKAIARK